MEWIIDKSHTLYAVFLYTEEDITIQIGALGCFTFIKGQYVYVGSAKRNLLKRVERHYKIDKVKRWHLDYLRPYCQITKIESFQDSEGECSLAAEFAKKGEIWIKNFGASDCKCSGHLIRLNT